MSAGLSDGFVYAPKPPAAPAANIRVSVPPHNKDIFRDGDVIMFNIPSGKRGQYLNTRMSYLKFDLEVAVDTKGTKSHLKPVLALDGGAHSLFQNLEVYHGSNLLEQIREYNSLYQLLFDMGETSSGRANGRTVAEGVRTHDKQVTGDQLVSNSGSADGRLGSIVSGACFSESLESMDQDPYYPDFIPVAYVAKPDQLSRAYKTLNEDNFKGTVGVLNNNQTITTSYCHPLLSGIVGGQQSKYLPVGGLATDLRLELTVAPFTHALKAVGAVVQCGVGASDKAASANFTPGVCTPSKAYETTAFTGAGTFSHTVPTFSSGAQTAGTAHTHPIDVTMSNVPVTITGVNKTGRWKDGNTSSQGGSYFTSDPTTLKEMAESVGLGECTIRITNAELVLEYIEVSSDVQMAIEGSTGGNYILSFESWNNFQNTIKANPGSVAQLIGAKFSSIKTATTMFRDQYMINNLAYSSVTSRLNPFNTRPNREDDVKSSGMPYLRGKWLNGTGWYYQVGATHYPPKPISCDEESWMEAVKSQHAVAVMQMPGNINKDTWSVSARRDTDSLSNIDSNPSKWWHYPLQGGTFFCAQNFESQSHKSHLTESGINTLAQSMYLVARFPPEGTIDGMVQVTKDIADGKFKVYETTADTGGPWRQINQALQLDTFVHYDGILLISNGICSTRF